MSTMLFQSIKSFFQFDNNIITKGSEEDKSDGNIKCTKMESFPFGSYIPNGIGGDVRVVFLSDIHCKQYKVGFGVDVTHPNTLTQDEKLELSIQSLPCGDILIVSGDFGETGLVEELQMFNAFLKGLSAAGKFKHIVFICGNHERTIDVDFYEGEGWRYHRERQDVIACRSALLNDLPENIHYLSDSSVVVEGLKFYGTPWVVGGDVCSSETSPAHFRWAYSVTEEELVAKFAQIPEDVDILVTHMPPYGIGDGRRNYDKDYFDENEKQVMGYDHVGSTSLRERLSALNPLVHCYGHIHSGYGAYRPNLKMGPAEGSAEGSARVLVCDSPSTLFVNAANCDEDYVPIQPALVVDIHARRPVAANSGVEHCSKSKTKTKLDTAVALMVTVDDSEQCGNTSTRSADLSKLKTATRLFLKQVLSTESLNDESNSPATKPNKMPKSEKKTMTRNLKEKARVDEMEAELTQLFAEYSLLEHVHAARARSIGGSEDSNEHFRSMQLVVPHLYIGSIYPSECLDTLNKFGITHIVNCCKGTEPLFPNEMTYFNVQVDDVESEDLSRFFIDCIAFIDAAMGSNTATSSSTSTNTNSATSKSSNVFVHCHMGISRSAAVVIAYLMFTMQLTYRAARALVHRARPFICPNDGFIDQLMQFEHSLRLKNK